MKKSKRNGFTLIETLLALLICSVVSLLCVCLIQTSYKLFSITSIHQHQLAILQIRQICSLSNNINVSDGNLSMLYQRKIITISYKNNRLVQEDGYVIWMDDLDSAVFYKIDEDIYLEWEAYGKAYQAQIT